MIGRIFLLTLIVTILLTGGNPKDFSSSRNDCKCRWYHCGWEENSISQCQQITSHKIWCCPESYCRENPKDCSPSGNDCKCRWYHCGWEEKSISQCQQITSYKIWCCPESYCHASTTSLKETGRTITISSMLLTTGATTTTSIPTTTLLSLSSTVTPIAETSPTSSLPLPISSMKTKPLPQSASLSSTTKISPSKTRRSWKTLVSEYLSSIRALSVEKQDSIQKASNITSILLQDLREERPDEVNLLVATYELESFAIKYGKTHLTAKKKATVRQDLFEMKIQRVLENNTNPFTCSKSDGTESIIVPSENLKGQDVVTVCTLFDGEIKRWIPDENRIDLNSKTIMNLKLSNIIGSTVDPRPQDDVLQKNVTVIFRYEEGLEAHCVFWDFTAKSNFNGSWSRKGCSVVNITKTEITCTCNHLTNFAVLMHVGADNEVPADHKVSLKVITYVGCALSLIGEALTAVAYCVLMDLKEDQTQIRFNLVVAIAIAQITFLAGIDATEVTELCVFVAAMIHYFYLVGFAWMLFEGVYLYLMVVKVFYTVIRLRLFYGVAWGVSLLIVVLSIVIASIQDGGIESYVHNHFCWVSFKNNLIWTFVAPVLLVCTINSVLLARVVHEILRMQADKTSHLERVRQGVKACVVLFPLLGLTWVFGVLSVTDAGLVFQYIFTIFNSLQGLFIFILHALRNNDVRAAYSRKMQKRNAAKIVKNSHKNRNTIGLWSSKVANEPSCTKEPSNASLGSTVGVKSKIDNALHEERTMTPVDT